MSVTLGQTRPTASAPPPRPSARRTQRGARYLAGVATGILSLLLLGLCLHLALVSHVAYARAQQLADDQLRLQLAQGTAPVAQYYIDDDATAAAGQPHNPGPSVSPTTSPATVDPARSTVHLHPGGTPIAMLSIPSIGLSTIVGEGTTSQDLQSGPGHDRLSAFPGQVGTSTILGRRWSYGAPFGSLPSISVGDRVSVTTGQGRHDYEVTGVRRPGDQGTVRAKGEGRLVLVTAEGAPFSPDQPVYVDATLISAPVPASRTLPIAPDLQAGPMAVDTAAWFPLVFWIQGLALAVVAFTWAWRTWGTRQTWLIGVPLLLIIGIGAAGTVSRLLPNLM